MDSNEPYLFNKEKERAFVRLSEFVIENEGTLVFAGDIFDFTGMTPCRSGHRQFFNEAVLPSELNLGIAEAACLQRSTIDLLSSISVFFPGFMRAVANLARKRRLIYIPGNHDCIFLTDQGRREFVSCLNRTLQADRALIAPENVRWLSEIQLPQLFIAAHGNQFDRDNRTDHGCLNRGFIFTSALYRAVLPALKMLGVPAEIIAALPAVRPEEQVIEGLSHYLNPEQLQRILIALSRLLQRNGFFRGPGAIIGWLLVHEVPVLSAFFRSSITPARVRKLLPNELSLVRSARRGAEKIRGLAKLSASHNSHNKAETGPDARPDLVVLGHTHELDLQPDYVNLGTWIDHITGLSPAALANVESALPVIRINETGEATVSNVRGLGSSDLLSSLEQCRELWCRPFNRPGQEKSES